VRAPGCLSTQKTRARDAFPKSREAAAKALDLNLTLAAAHAAMACVNYCGWDRSGAEKEFKRSAA